MPFGYYNASDYVEAQDHPVAADRRKPSAGYNLVGPDYFRLLKVPMVRGREFTEQDDERAPRVAVVNEFMAHLLWPGEDPIGKRFRTAGSDVWREVIGVTRNGQIPFHLRGSESVLLRADRAALRGASRAPDSHERTIPRRWCPQSRKRFAR